MCESDKENDEKEAYEKEAMEIFREVKFYLKYLFFIVILFINFAFISDIIRGIF